LIICEEGERRQKIAAMASSKCGLNPVYCSSLAEARSLLFRSDFKVVLCHDNLPDGDFRAALKEVKRTAAQAPVIVLSRKAEWDAYLHALGAGAFDYILCPPAPVEAERILRCALADSSHPPTSMHAAA
jgi:DNA-binding NtrC family response regulator